MKTQAELAALLSKVEEAKKMVEHLKAAEARGEVGYVGSRHAELLHKEQQAKYDAATGNKQERAAPQDAEQSGSKKTPKK